ncbi:MAG: hypothetical protein ABI203_02185 [Mucilaginibacter sp.]
MKSKFFLLVTVLSFALVTASRAQQKPLDFSIKVYGGYGLFSPGSDARIETSTAIANNEITSFQYRNVDLKLGQAPHFGVGVTLPISGLFTVGLDADYLSGKHNNKYTFSNNSFFDGSEPTSFHVLSFIPNISYNFYTNPRYSIYNTLGLIVAADSKLTDLIKSQNGGGDNQQISFGVNVGFKDAAGVKFRVTKNLQGFAEATAFFLSMSATKRVITFDTNSGITTQTFNRSGKSVYVSDHPQTSGEIATYNEAIEDPYHFSSIGINIGVVYSLK